MFGDIFEQLAAGLSVGRVTALVLVTLGVTLLVRGTYYRARSQQIVGGILTVFPSTFHYSLTTLFALSFTAESVELIAYLPLAHFERWQEAQDIILKVMKLLGYFAIAGGIWVLWHLHLNDQDRFRFSDCFLLTIVGFVFIYFIEISQIVSLVVTKLTV